MQLGNLTDQRINYTTLQFTKYHLKKFKEKYWRKCLFLHLPTKTTDVSVDDQQGKN